MSERRDIWEWMPMISPTRIIEIGCADGSDTSKLLHPRIARFVAFEPEPEMFTKADARIGNRVTLCPFAVSDKMGTEKFNRSASDHRWSGSLKEPREHLKCFPYVKFDEAIDVPCVTLDSIFPMMAGWIDLIWCDCQGAEDLVIAGGKKALQGTQWFYTEYYDIEMYSGQIPLAEIHKRLPGDWELADVWQNDALFKNKVF